MTCAGIADGDIGSIPGATLTEETHVGTGSCMPVCAGVTTTYRLDASAPADLVTHVEERLDRAGYTYDEGKDLWMLGGVGVSITRHHDRLTVGYSAGY